MQYIYIKLNGLKIKIGMTWLKKLLIIEIEEGCKNCSFNIWLTNENPAGPFCAALNDDKHDCKQLPENNKERPPEYCPLLNLDEINIDEKKFRKVKVGRKIVLMKSSTELTPTELNKKIYVWGGGIFL